jgi:phosphoribosyl 1,2-cyclic phosphodiesterase
VRIASLGSGSRGNATLIARDDTLLLVDCGFSLSELERRAVERGVELASLDAVLVTHEHSDHASGVAALARRFDLPVYLTHGTLASGRIEGRLDLRLFDADSCFSIGAIDVQAVPVPHDAREPVQYVFSAAGFRVGVLTDLGSVTTHVATAYRDCDLLLLEFNHDMAMLAQGPYPPALKRRVGGAWGHLSNGQAAELLLALEHSRLWRLFIAHISEKNNSRECVEAVLAEQLPELLPRVTWASQSDGFPWFDLASVTPVTSSPLVCGESIRAY